jgi:RimJ/RimL family protein N-acetyltransferase
MTVRLRPTTKADEEMVFGWRNDPFLVARATSQRTVTRAEHGRWFEATLEGRLRKMFIVEVDGEPAGQVRFDRGQETDCVISAYLLESFTGRGLGVEAIRSGCAEIARQWKIERVVACVRHDNPAGHSAFLKAGFRDSPEVAGCCPVDHYSMVWENAGQ